MRACSARARKGLPVWLLSFFPLSQERCVCVRLPNRLFCVRFFCQVRVNNNNESKIKSEIPTAVHDKLRKTAITPTPSFAKYCPQSVVTVWTYQYLYLVSCASTYVKYCGGCVDISIPVAYVLRKYLCKHTVVAV